MKCELNCGKTCQGELKKCCKHNNILSKSNGISFIVLSNQEYFEVDISILCAIVLKIVIFVRFCMAVSEH